MTDDYSEPWVANKIDVLSGAVLQTEFVGDSLGAILETFCTQGEWAEPYSVEVAVDPNDAAVGNPVFIVSLLSDVHPVERYSVTRPHWVG